MPGDHRVAGDLFAELIADNLDRQQRRKASLEQRGLAVVTTSATLVTLAFGFVSLAGRDDGDFSVAAGVLLVAALVGFITAAVLGLIINSTRAYSYLSTASLERMCQPRYWGSDPANAARQVAVMQVRSLEVARTNNAAKARLLRFAITVEVAAVGLLGLASVATI